MDRRAFSGRTARPHWISSLILRSKNIRPTMSIAITSESMRRSSPAFPMSERSRCADESRPIRCSRRRILPSALPAANCAPPTCRTCWSSMSPRSTPNRWRKSSMRSVSESEVPLSRAARRVQRHGILQDGHHRNQSFSRWLVEELEERLPGFDQHLKLHVTGCPNSCGQHWIADIGIEGKKIKVQIAWSMPTTSAWAERSVCIRPRRGLSDIAAPRPKFRMRLNGCSAHYLAQREPGENLRRFFARHSDTQLREFLAGEVVAAVARDLPIRLAVWRNCRRDR